MPSHCNDFQHRKCASALDSLCGFCPVDTVSYSTSFSLQRGPQYYRHISSLRLSLSTRACGQDRPFLEFKQRWRKECSSFCVAPYCFKVFWVWRRKSQMTSAEAAHTQSSCAGLEHHKYRPHSTGFGLPFSLPFKTRGRLHLAQHSDPFLRHDVTVHMCEESYQILPPVQRFPVSPAEYPRLQNSLALLRQAS